MMMLLRNIGARSFHATSRCSKVTVIGSEDALTKALKTHPSVIYYTATWCGPCQRIAPEYEKLESQSKGLNFYKVDIDEFQDHAVEVGIQAVPSFHFYNKEGKVSGKVIGGDLAKLKELIASNSSS
jgi:thioredoxin 1